MLVWLSWLEHWSYVPKVDGSSPSSSNTNSVFLLYPVSSVGRAPAFYITCSKLVVGGSSPLSGGLVSIHIEYEYTLVFIYEMLI